MTLCILFDSVLFFLQRKNILDKGSAPKAEYMCEDSRLAHCPYSSEFLLAMKWNFLQESPEKKGIC